MTSGSSAPPEILTPRARLLLPIFLLLLLTLAVRQLWCQAPARAWLGGETMGTTWSVTLAAQGRPRAELEQARRAVEASLAAVNRRMSTWDPDSELSRFNRHRSLEPFALSAPTLEVLALAQRVAERSGGAFDATVRPLVAAWGFGAGARAPGRAPEAEELAALRRRVGFRLLELDPEAGSARKRVPELECDLSAIAKGYAVDEAARALQALGWQDFLVEVGGELRAAGRRPGGEPWQVGIERPAGASGGPGAPDAVQATSDPAPGAAGNPRLQRRAHAVVPLLDRAMATSGDYRSFYASEGRRLSHIIDPRSGRPVEHALASVTVVHAEAVLADAWATALSVLGPEEGFARAEAEGLGAYFILRRESGGFEFRATRGFPALRPLSEGGGRDPAAARG